MNPRADVVKEFRLHPELARTFMADGRRMSGALLSCGCKEMREEAADGSLLWLTVVECDRHGWRGRGGQ